METRYRALVAAVERAINDADLIGLLECGAPADEYSPEIGTIVPTVVNAQSVDEITATLHEEFQRWFGERHRRSSTDIRSASARDLGSSTRIPKERLTLNSGSACRAHEIELPQPTGDPVPTRVVLVHFLRFAQSADADRTQSRGRPFESASLRHEIASAVTTEPIASACIKAIHPHQTRSSRTRAEYVVASVHALLTGVSTRGKRFRIS
jgi:hypothetical protein